MLYSFDDGSAKGKRTTQYFEMFCNRGIYHDGWFACSRFGLPWEPSTRAADFTKAPWELYNIEEDFSQANDLAAKNPDEAQGAPSQVPGGSEKYDVLPLDPRWTERFDPKIRVSGEPPTSGRTSATTSGCRNRSVRSSSRADTHHCRANCSTKRRRRRGRLRRLILCRLVAVRERQQATLPLHLL